MSLNHLCDCVEDLGYDAAFLDALEMARSNPWVSDGPVTRLIIDLVTELLDFQPKTNDACAILDDLILDSRFAYLFEESGFFGNSSRNLLEFSCIRQDRNQQLFNGAIKSAVAMNEEQLWQVLIDICNELFVQRMEKKKFGKINRMVEELQKQRLINFEVTTDVAEKNYCFYVSEVETIKQLECALKIKNAASLQECVDQVANALCNFVPRKEAFLFQAKDFNQVQIQSLVKMNEIFGADYSTRKQILLQRLSITVDSMKLSNRLPANLTIFEEIKSFFNQTKSQIDLANLFTITPTSVRLFPRLNSSTTSFLKKHLIGTVRDRGGRTGIEVDHFEDKKIGILFCLAHNHTADKGKRFGGSIESFSKPQKAPKRSKK